MYIILQRMGAKESCTKAELREPPLQHGRVLATDGDDA